MTNANEQNGLVKVPGIKATCPACGDRLEPMDLCALGAVGVCPSPTCAVLVRRDAEAVRLYTEAEAKDAHPDALARLHQIQKDLKAGAVGDR